MPTAGVARSVREGRLDCADAPTHPAGDRAKEKGDEAKQPGSRHGLGRYLSGLRGLLLDLINCLPILLLVSLNLRASILNRDVLRVRYRLGRALARFFRVLLIAGDGRTHGCDSRVSQGGWIVSRSCTPQRLLD
jgi:hypothetical protein